MRKRILIFAWISFIALGAFGQNNGDQKAVKSITLDDALKLYISLEKLCGGI